MAITATPPTEAPAMAPTLTLLPPEDEREDESEDEDVCEGESGSAKVEEALRVVAAGGVVVVPELIKAPGAISGVTKNRGSEAAKENTERIPTAGVQRFDGVKIGRDLAYGVSKDRKG
jgi:hypothetical protein